jgi:hypothetical protein
MADNEDGPEFENRICNLILSDVDQAVARILLKVEYESKSEVIEELHNEVDEELILETRESMFKAATCRYIDLLENDGYQSGSGIPVLILKRRKGDQMRVKNCKDVVELLVFASGLGDIFPRDTLSSPGSKFVELRFKEPNRIRDNQVVCDNPNDTTVAGNDKLLVSTLSNRIRDQENQIKGMKDELVRTRTDMNLKMDNITQLLHVLLRNSGLSASGTTTQQPSTAQSLRVEKPTTETDNNSHTFTQPTVIESKGPIVVPLLGSLEDDNAGGASEEECETVENQPNSNQRGCAAAPLLSSSYAPASATETSSDDNTPRKMQYSEAAAIPGHWKKQISRRQRRAYRDERDTKDTHKPSTSVVKNKFGNTRLKGANHETMSLVYVRNFEITDEDNDETIAESVKGYCRDKGVKVMRVHVVFNRYNDYIVGCKLSVANAQKHKLISDNFWPSHIQCREWRQDVTTNTKYSRDVKTMYNENTKTISRTVCTDDMNNDQRRGSRYDLDNDDNRY